MDWLWVPLTQVLLARHLNWAASGAAVNASRASRRAWTLTPLSTGVSVTDMGNPPLVGRGIPTSSVGICMLRGRPVYADRPGLGSGALSRSNLPPPFPGPGSTIGVTYQTVDGDVPGGRDADAGLQDLRRRQPLLRGRGHLHPVR